MTEDWEMTYQVLDRTLLTLWLERLVDRSLQRQDKPGWLITQLFHQWFIRTGCQYWSCNQFQWSSRPIKALLGFKGNCVRDDAIHPSEGWLHSLLQHTHLPPASSAPASQCSPVILQVPATDQGWGAVLLGWSLWSTAAHPLASPHNQDHTLQVGLLPAPSHPVLEALISCAS